MTMFRPLARKLGLSSLGNARGHGGDWPLPLRSPGMASALDDDAPSPLSFRGIGGFIDDAPGTHGSSAGKAEAGFRVSPANGAGDPEIKSWRGVRVDGAALRCGAPS